MFGAINRHDSPIVTVIMGFSAVLLVVCIVLYPDQAFQASLQGLSIWWKLVFPALLPFLVLSEILIAFGWVHALGVLIDPLLRVLFRIPGVGGWAMSLGWTAGYPAGAVAAVKLRQQKALSRQEAQRLLALSHVSNPVFMIVVVGVGFLHQAELGLMIAIVHWSSIVITGLLLRWFAPPSPEPAPERAALARSASVKGGMFARVRRMIEAMRDAHRQDGRSFGKLLGEAVGSAVQTLLMVGGYMMIFSVVIQVVRLAVPQEISRYAINGLFEINLGAHAVSTAPFASQMWQMALLGAILAWSGISAHLQVRSITRATDLSYASFLGARLLHAAVAFVLTFALWQPLQRLVGGNVRSLTTLYAPQSWDASREAAAPLTESLFRALTAVQPYALLLWLILLLSLMIVLSAAIAAFRPRKP